MINIVVVGAGYVGLVTGACFAQKNNQVIIVENNKEKIDALLAGKVPFYEPGLDELVAQGIKNKKLVFVDTIDKALVQKPEIIFSCVGTPPLPDGSADLSYVWGVAKEIGKSLDHYCVIVNKSTVPVGTAGKVKAIVQDQLDKRLSSAQFDVVSNPEFLKEGDALQDFLEPDRVVIGTETEKARAVMRKLYEPFLKTQEQFIVMNTASAELTKYASNSMLATRISFMNQMALLADKVGADINDVKMGMAADRRIGKYFLNAGIGYGGSCFPKDVKALIQTGKEYSQPMSIVQDVDHVNDRQREYFIEKIIASYGPELKNKQVGIWGLAFKPETDDIRCAPSIDVITRLLEKGTSIVAYDPVAQENIQKLFGDKISYASQSCDLLSSDFLIILTEWSEFKAYDLEKFKLLRDKTVFDGRNCFDPKLMAQHGIRYITVGRNVLSEQAKQDQDMCNTCYTNAKTKEQITSL